MSLFYKKAAGMAICTLFSVTSLYAQQIGGIVSDAKGPLAGVSITVKGSNRGTKSGPDGSFTIQAAKGDILRLSIIGHKPLELPVDPSGKMNVILTEDAATLGEVVVTAMGIKHSPKELGYAMNTVDAKDLTKTGSPNFAGALYGKAPGVRISAAPGGATSGININIRGINSITGTSQPLIIIDGVPLRTTTFNNAGYWQDSRARGNGLEDLNPEDIASISVLKGASAAALYGSEAMNGVVLVTTKSGKAGAGFTLDFNATYTHDRIAYLPRFQQVRGLGYSKAYQDDKQADDLFFYNETPVNGVSRGMMNTQLNFGPLFDGKDIIAWNGQVRPYSAQNAYQKFFNNPNNSIFNLAIGNSTENSTIRFSLTRQDNQMTGLDSYNKKNIANLNANFNLWKKFKNDVVINFVNQHTHNRPLLTDRLVNNFAGMISTFDNPEWYFDKYQTSLGYKYVLEGAGAQSLTPKENIRYNGYRGDVLEYFWNARAKQYDEYANRLIGSYTATWLVNNELSLRARVSADITALRTEDRQPNEKPVVFGYSGFFSLGNQNANIYYTDLLATYNKQLNPNVKIGIVGGYTATRSQDVYVQNQTDGGLAERNWYDVNASYNLPIRSDRYNYRNYSLRDAFFGTLNFNLKEFWNVEGTLRREVISTMHPDQNVLYYPSANSSLILSDAFKLPEIFNYAKLRASWGIVGRYPDIYQSALFYNQKTLGVQSAGGPSVVYTTVPTTDFGYEGIQPETKNEVEFGLETRLFKGRLGVDITYYNSVIKNQIMRYTLPISSGSGNVLTNLGKLHNSGWEFAINGLPIQGEHFKWSSTLNFSMNKNIIQELPGNAESLTLRDYDGGAAQVLARVGQPIGDIMVRPVLRDEQGYKRVGANGLYQLDGNSWIKAGNAMPKAVGGFVNNFTYRNFSLDVLVDFRLGGSVMPTGINWMISRGLLEESLNHMDAAHGGLSYYQTKDGAGNTIGIATTGTTGPNGETVYHDGMLMDGVLADGSKNSNIISQATYYDKTYNWGGPQYSQSRYELYVQKNNYVKMREISFGYRLPAAVAARLKAKNLQLSAFGRNLFFVYRSVKDLDPEQMTAGDNWINNVSNAGTSPATRTYGLMLRASF